MLLFGTLSQTVSYRSMMSWVMMPLHLLILICMSRV